MQQEDYDMKLQNMTDDGIRQGIYSPTVDTTLSNLKKFQDFLHRNFKGKCDRYDDMRPISNQPGKIYATAKTHKFDLLENITIKISSFVQQFVNYFLTYLQCWKDTIRLLENLKPFYQNEYKINDAQSFASHIKEQPPLNEDEECLTRCGFLIHYYSCARND